VDVNSIRSRRMRPDSWSTSYLLRSPLGISTSTSNSSTCFLRGSRAARRRRRPAALTAIVNGRVPSGAQCPAQWPGPCTRWGTHRGERGDAVARDGARNGTSSGRDERRGVAGTLVLVLVLALVAGGVLSWRNGWLDRW